MKLKFFLLTFVLISGVSLSGETIGAFVNIGNGIGLGNFFHKNVYQQIENSIDYQFEKRNYDGFGFQIGLFYNLFDKFDLSVGWGLNSGNSKREKWPVNEEGNKSRITYYFRFWTLRLRAEYKLLQLRNGWQLHPFIGFSLNKIVRDDQPLFFKSSFSGIELGLKTHYQIFNRWGWHFEAAYNQFFSSGGFKRLRMATGLSVHI